VNITKADEQKLMSDPGHHYFWILIAISVNDMKDQGEGLWTYA
jgi:hypothetical protein